MWLMETTKFPIGIVICLQTQLGLKLSFSVRSDGSSMTCGIFYNVFCWLLHRKIHSIPKQQNLSLNSCVSNAVVSNFFFFFHYTDWQRKYVSHSSKKIIAILVRTSEQIGAKNWIKLHDLKWDIFSPFKEISSLEASFSHRVIV